MPLDQLALSPSESAPVSHPYWSVLFLSIFYETYYISVLNVSLLKHLNRPIENWLVYRTVVPTLKAVTANTAGQARFARSRYWTDGGAFRREHWRIADWQRREISRIHGARRAPSPLALRHGAIRRHGTEYQMSNADNHCHDQWWTALNVA